MASKKLTIAKTNNSSSSRGYRGFVSNIFKDGNKKPQQYSTETPENDDIDLFPMHLAMAKLTVTPTGFVDPKSREDACSKILMMCGEVSHSFTTRTTHLVAAHANTSKVETAHQRNIPVMSLEWLENIWNACQSDPYIHASLPQFQNYNIPVFYNLHFGVSKYMDMNIIEYCEGLLQQHGGVIVTKLKNSPTNYFYICQHPEVSRQYTFAKDKKIPCLTYGWIIESISYGLLAACEDFEVKNGPPINMTYNLPKRTAPGKENEVNYGTMDEHGIANANNKTSNDFMETSDLSTTMTCNREAETNINAKNVANNCYVQQETSDLIDFSTTITYNPTETSFDTTLTGDENLEGTGTSVAA